ncbi:MAG: HyaD/HybD family hydrogenase maturation endopeptidase [Calditrichaceae bacterium]|jgi:hydrogenase maturation protease
MADSKIAVFGIGNLLQKDEGVGVHLINRLEKEYTFSPHISLIDGGTMGTDLLPYLEENDKVIILDAVNFDEPPGFIGVIENDDILRRLNTKLSIHHLGLTDVLSSARLLDIEPSEIYLIGIQPKNIEMGTELTDEINQQTGKMIDAAIKKLMEWGIEVNSK